MTFSTSKSETLYLIEVLEEDTSRLLELLDYDLCEDRFNKIVMNKNILKKLRFLLQT